MVEIAVKLLVSLAFVMLVAWLARRMQLGGDKRIRSEEQASALAKEAVYGFEAEEVALDRAGIGALLKDRSGQVMILRRHGAQFVGRLLDGTTGVRLDQGFLTIATSDKSFGKVTLNLGENAAIWAAGLRRLAV